MFPVLGSNPKQSIPWSVVAGFAGNAQRNHGQTLERLAERGGLCWIELWWIMNGKRWRDPHPSEEVCREFVLSQKARGC